jgi:hypothetical protein
MKVTKAVALDEKTAPIAARMNNFSKFVRMSLLAHDQDMSESDRLLSEATLSRALDLAVLLLLEVPGYEEWNPHTLRSKLRHEASQTTLEDFV